MSKSIRKIFKNETFSLHECTDGFWLYDYIIGMNISMRAKTEQEAFIEALLYYQKKLVKVKKNYKILNDKVESFLFQFNQNDE